MDLVRVRPLIGRPAPARAQVETRTGECAVPAPLRGRCGARPGGVLLRRRRRWSCSFDSAVSGTGRLNAWPSTGLAVDDSSHRGRRHHPRVGRRPRLALRACRRRTRPATRHAARPAPGPTSGTHLVVLQTGARPVAICGDAAVWSGELDEPRAEGQRRIRALDPEMVWLAHAHEPWRPGVARTDDQDPTECRGRCLSPADLEELDRGPAAARVACQPRSAARSAPLTAAPLSR